MLDVDRCVEIGVRAVAADHTAKRLLVGPILPMCIIAHTARLGGISASDSDCGDTPFGGIPGKLLRDVRKAWKRTNRRSWLWPCTSSRRPTGVRRRIARPRAQ